ncbi:hypothetical protein ACS0TY_003305 [Phlomoides rotata]
MSSPCYRCHDCHFVAHPICADHFPGSFEIFLGPVHSEALLHKDQFFNSAFPCSRCLLPSNGVSYKIVEDDREGYHLYDLECAVAPKTVKHASHKQHILFITGASNTFISTAFPQLGVCPKSSSGNLMLIMNFITILSLLLGCLPIKDMRGVEFADETSKAFQMMKWLSIVLSVIFGFTFPVQLPSLEWGII